MGVAKMTDDDGKTTPTIDNRTMGDADGMATTPKISHVTIAEEEDDGLVRPPTIAMIDTRTIIGRGNNGTITGMKNDATMSTMSTTACCAMSSGEYDSRSLEGTPLPPNLS